MKLDQITRAAGFTSALLASAVACSERTQSGAEQCFYVDPGYWIDPGPTWRTCDDSMQLPEGPENTTLVQAIVRRAPDENGECDICPALEFDDEFIEPARKAASATHVCSEEGAVVVELHRECVSPPEQTAAAGNSDDCWYRAWAFIACDDDV